MAEWYNFSERVIFSSLENWEKKQVFADFLCYLDVNTSLLFIEHQADPQLSEMAFRDRA